jgi:tetratricopeptide (TPR) repeat protein
MYRGDHENATKTYKKFLSMECNNVERGQAMVNLATTDPESAEYWLKNASFETPGHREPLVSLARMFYDKKDWANCYKYANKALEITKHPMDYTCTPEAWGAYPHDLLSIAAWELGLRDESLIHAKRALELEPNNIRFQNNVKSIEQFMISNGIK